MKITPTYDHDGDIITSKDNLFEAKGIGNQSEAGKGGKGLAAS